MAKFKKKKKRKHSKKRGGAAPRRRRGGGGGGKARRRGGGGKKRGGNLKRFAVIAGGVALGATLLARANIKALKEEPDDTKAKMSWYRKANIIKPIGVLGTGTAAAATAAYFDAFKDAPAVAFGLAVASGIQLANHGGLFAKDETTADQGMVKVAGVDLAMGGDVLDEQHDMLDG